MGGPPIEPPVNSFSGPAPFQPATPFGQVVGAFGSRPSAAAMTPSPAFGIPFQRSPAEAMPTAGPFGGVFLPPRCCCFCKAAVIDCTCFSVRRVCTYISCIACCNNVLRCHPRNAKPFWQSSCFQCSSTAKSIPGTSTAASHECADVRSAAAGAAAARLPAVTSRKPIPQPRCNSAFNLSQLSCCRATINAFIATKHRIGVRNQVMPSNEAPPEQNCVHLGEWLSGCMSRPSKQRSSL